MSYPVAVGSLIARRARLLATLVLATATVAALAALPTASAAGTQVSLPPVEQVEAILGQTPLEALPTGELTEKLAELQAFEGVEAGVLEEAIEQVVELLKGNGGTLEELTGGGEGATLLKEKLEELLGPLAGQLETLLGGDPQTKLEEVLNSLGISELVSKLLSGSGEPQALLQQILNALTPEKLQELLGTVLAGTPVASTIEQLAGQLGTSSQALAEQFGKTAEQLPGTATALVAPLANGEKLTVIPGAEGLTLGLIKETVGSTGGTGAPGAPGAPGSAGQPTPAPAPAPANSAAAKPGKVKVLSHSFKHHRATIVVQVPSAGVVTLSGKRLRGVHREAAKAERVTLHPVLTRAGSASLHKGHRHHSVKVPVKVFFKPVTGASSSSTVPLVYR